MMRIAESHHVRLVPTPDSCSAANLHKPWPALKGPATIAKPANNALLSSEAIEQPVPAGAAEVALAATTIGPARGMRGIPRSRRGIIVQAFTVDMAHHGRTLGAARPVAAGAI